MKLIELCVFNKIGTKKQIKKWIKQKRFQINHEIIEENIEVTGNVYLDNKPLHLVPLLYYMFYKPIGYECSLVSSQYPTIYSLFQDPSMHIVGRLDVETSGLIILTNDVKLRKQLLLPENQIVREYTYTCLKPITSKEVDLVKNGIVINKNDKVYANIELINDYHGKIQLTEGKYHEVRKIFLSLNNQIVSLKRNKFDCITLDIEEGTSRLLTKQEIEKLKERVNKNG